MFISKKALVLATAFLSNSLIGYGAYLSMNKAEAYAVQPPVAASLSIRFDEDIIRPVQWSAYTYLGAPYTIDTKEIEEASFIGAIPANQYYKAHNEPRPPEHPRNVKFSEINDDILCLAQNIYHEARGEGREGMEAVALTTLNRVGHKRWRQTVCSVVYQKYQFSWVLEKPFMDLSRQTERNSFLEAIEVAQLAVSGKLDNNKIKGANHYYNPKGVIGPQPTWPEKMELVSIVGNHKFYKD